MNGGSGSSAAGRRLAKGKSTSGRSKDPEQRGKMALEERRTLILKEAARLFFERGYEAVSINDIIDATGGSKATIYGLFGDKEGLFDEFVRAQTSPIALSIPLDTSGPIAQQLSALARNFLTKVLQPKTIEFHRLMVTLGRNSPERARLFFQSGPKTAYRSFAGWFAERQRAGELGGGDPYELGVLFHDMLISELQLAMLTGEIVACDADAIERKIASAVRLFLAGCAAAPAGGKLL